MKRINIILTNNQYDNLNIIKEKTGNSIASIIRSYINENIGG